MSVLEKVAVGCGVLLMAWSAADAFEGKHSSPEILQKDYPSLSIQDAKKVQSETRNGDLGWGVMGLNLVLANLISRRPS